MNKFADRTGEARLMRNGLVAIVTAYRNAHDIDVIFPNGGTREHLQYSRFKRGSISCPMIFEQIDAYVIVTNPNTSPLFTFLVDAEDIGLLGNGLWHDSGDGYAEGRIDGVKEYLHRVIMQAPNDMDVDHISGDKSDYRKTNLRVCTGTDNNRNKLRNSNNSSGYKGVSWNKLSRKWRAQIGFDSKNIHIGIFADRHSAALAYNEAALKYHGEFAKLNKFGAENEAEKQAG